MHRKKRLERKRKCIVIFNTYKLIKIWPKPPLLQMTILNLFYWYFHTECSSFLFFFFQLHCRTTIDQLKTNLPEAFQIRPSMSYHQQPEDDDGDGHAVDVDTVSFLLEASSNPPFCLVLIIFWSNVMWRDVYSIVSCL